ncbi:MAG: hypothetical protein ACI8S6_000397 [Myxococcota bacterium]|jgi:hypothetical protein
MAQLKRTLAAALLAAAPLILWAPASAEEPVVSSSVDEDDPIAGQKAWMVRMARMEGAAGNVRESAEQLRTSLVRIASSGRLVGMAEVVSSADELNRRVQSSMLAVEVLDQRL